MQTLTSSSLVSDHPLTLIRLSVKCPTCGWVYSGSIEPCDNLPYCNDKECVGCKTIFKARYKFSNESCKICEYKLYCLGKPVVDVEELILYTLLGDINWSM
jgi:hypothetical protein